MMSARQILAYIYLALAQTMVGVSIVGSKYIVGKIDLFQLLFLRFSLGTLLIYIAAKIVNPAGKLRYRDLDKVDWFFLTMQALTAGFFFNLLLLSGLKLTTASIAGVLTSSLPALIFIFSFLFLKETLTVAKLQCIGLAMIGLLCINYKNLMGEHAPGSSFLGNLIVMLALLPEASFYILVKIRFTRLPTGLSGVMIMLINAICFFPFAFVHSSSERLLNLSYFDWGVLCILGLCSALFYIFWGLGSKEIEASVGSLFTAVMPVATLIIAWMILDEKLTWLQLVGMAFILLSIFASTRTIRQYKKVEKPASQSG